MTFPIKLYVKSKRLDDSIFVQSNIKLFRRIHKWQFISKACGAWFIFRPWASRGNPAPPWGFLKTSIFRKYVILALQKRLSDQKSLVEYAKEANLKW